MLLQPTVRALGTVVIMAIAVQAMSAELRTTVAEKTIYRQASFAAERAQDDSRVVPASGVFGDDVFQHPSLPACGSCGKGGCNMACVDACGRWAQFDYLLWWRRGTDLPALATSGVNQAGVLGDPTTRILFGGDGYGEDATPGGRITLGKWLDTCQCNSVEGRFFALADQTVGFNSASNGDPILARPFNNQDAAIGPLGPTSRPLAFPNIATNGSISILGESELYGGDVVIRHQFCQTGCTVIDWVIGYQYTRITEGLTITDSLVDINPNNLIADGTRQSIVDQFDARNEFHGGLIGLEATYLGEGWRLEMLARLAFGSMRQLVMIAGQTTSDVPNDPNSPFVLNEGLLAGAGNQGRFERDEFAVVPELGATMIYELNSCIDLSFGYSFMYWSNVVQAGNLIDPNLFVPSQFAFNDSSYWVHGLNAGVEVRF